LLSVGIKALVRQLFKRITGKPRAQYACGQRKLKIPVALEGMEIARYTRVAKENGDPPRSRGHANP
jgi:hypothetical protein